MNILARGVVWKDTSARYPEVQSRVWLQLMCCALLINQVPNFGVRSKVGTRLNIGVLEPGQRLWCLKLKHYNLDRP